MSQFPQTKLLALGVALLLAGCAAGPPPEDEIFPYAHQIDDLPNGLRLVTVTTGYPNIVALYTVFKWDRGMKSNPGALALRTCLNT